MMRVVAATSQATFHTFYLATSCLAHVGLLGRWYPPATHCMGTPSQRTRPTWCLIHLTSGEGISPITARLVVCVGGDGCRC